MDCLYCAWSLSYPYSACHLMKTVQHVSAMLFADEHDMVLQGCMLLGVQTMLLSKISAYQQDPRLALGMQTHCHKSP